MSTKRLTTLLLFLCLAVMFHGCGNSGRHMAESDEVESTDKEASYFYGIRVDSLNIVKDRIAPNMFLAEILSGYRVDYNTIHQITESARGVFDFRRLRAGQNFYVLHSNDSTAMPQYFIYDMNAFEYIVCDIRNSVCVYAGQKPIRTEEKTASGTIDHSLYVTLDERDIHPTLALSLSNIFAWTIDFYHLQKGDRFKVIYKERFVDSTSLGVSEIEAAVFDHRGREIYACRYMPTNDSIYNYFDQEGESLRKAFLKSPLKFGRMTSAYSGRRFHPVQKRYKAHKGTDYAAPTGTPIMATSDGVVVEATYKKHNGNYVKLRHNSKYMTQYLHMSGFAPGIKPGKFVRQGETIGYVGSTGLATGPHVCYRFWKDGEQVDHTKEDLPPSDPIPADDMKNYLAHFSTVRARLDAIEYPAPQEGSPADSLLAVKAP